MYAFLAFKLQKEEVKCGSLLPLIPKCFGNMVRDQVDKAFGLKSTPRHEASVKPVHQRFQHDQSASEQGSIESSILSSTSASITTSSEERLAVGKMMGTYISSLLLVPGSGHPKEGCARVEEKDKAFKLVLPRKAGKTPSGLVCINIISSSCQNANAETEQFISDRRKEDQIPT
ncbi:hypothetical protein Y1Q_0002485 [Alligator mississippiensis]|uniref:Uncharacterized protein n=1 Tax=Alligator mississippiensis TaxID=8496 RepID=A0A151NBJ9_ALLMI|nr:hypothetical protein Y1Q_0002485 [Alligator mississippiensis]